MHLNASFISCTGAFSPNSFRSAHEIFYATISYVNISLPCYTKHSITFVSLCNMKSKIYCYEPYFVLIFWQRSNAFQMPVLFCTGAFSP